ncbi:unnamed protein product, partial [Ixodes persulcatus]
GRSVDRRALLLDKRSVACGWVGLAFLLFSSSYVQRQKWSFLDIVFSETGATGTLHQLPGGEHVTFQKGCSVTKFCTILFTRCLRPRARLFLSSFASLFLGMSRGYATTCLGLPGFSIALLCVTQKSVLRGVNSSWTIPLGSRLSHSGRAEPIRLELLHSQSHGTFSVARLICLCRCTVHCPCQSPPPLPRRRRLDYVSRA